MTYKVHALTDTGYLFPDGDGYAPQIAITWDRFRTHTTELNATLIPAITPAQLANAFESFNNDAELTARWARIVAGCNVIAVKSTGYSQGDIAQVFVFDSPAWREATGAQGITAEDGNSLGAWIWGDIYEVIDTEDEDNSFYVYGMDEAMKHGEIVFPTYHSYYSYED
jgi:hypothetical protein